MHNNGQNFNEALEQKRIQQIRQELQQSAQNAGNPGSNQGLS